MLSRSTDSPAPPSNIVIPPRFGHSMILDHASHTLYIFAGQYNNQYLSDMYTYNLYNNTVTKIYSNFTQEGYGPDSCFTQRAVGNAEEKEIYM
jgi:muskelin